MVFTKDEITAIAANYAPFDDERSEIEMPGTGFAIGDQVVLISCPEWWGEHRKPAIGHLGTVWGQTGQEQLAISFTGFRGYWYVDPKCLQLAKGT